MLDIFKKERLFKLGRTAHLQLLRVRELITLAVQVVRVECLDRFQHLVVMLIHELTIGSLSVPGVERVVADHCQAFFRDCRLILHDVIKIFIVAPADHDILQSTTRRVNSIFGAIHLVVIVLIVFERLVAENDPVIKGATDREGVANNVPLSFSPEEEQQLSKIVNQPHKLHPSGLSFVANRLGRLQQVRHLRLRGIGITFVDEGVQLFHCFPDCHMGTSLVLEIVACFQVVCHSLESVLLGIEILHLITSILELTEPLFIFGFVEFGFFIETFVLLQIRLVDVDSVDVVRHSLEADRG